MSENRNYINIGIVAHVDAGKTSITELFLHKSGVISEPGNVDKGTSQTDWLGVETERGISVRSASASLSWKDKIINIIDTPGHVDFSSEVERSMLAMDCAIIVISAVEGIQAHTETLWKAIRNIDIPVFFFINKTDRAGADTGSIIDELKRDFSDNIIIMQEVIDEGTNNADIDNYLGEDNSVPYDENILESIISDDHELLDRYFNEESISTEELEKSLRKQIQNREAFPVFIGSAKFDIGISELMDAISLYMPVASGDDSKPVSGVVFKVEHDKKYGKIASVRLFNGTITIRDLVCYSSEKKEAKITHLRKLQGKNYEEINMLHAGDTAAVCGLTDIRAGDIIGTSLDNPEPELLKPMLTVKVSPKDEKLYSELVTYMHIIADEDPAIDLLWLKDEREIHIRIFGIMQLQILEAILMERFDIEVVFGKPTVIYKETPITTGEGFEEYTMPKPCWAVVRFLIEPAERGSGVSFSSDVGVNDIARRYQHEVERTIPFALQQGNYGWEVTDLKITLLGDEDHNVHSRAGDFAVATPMAILKGLQKTGTTLLEPILNFTITAPEEKLGIVVSSLTQLRAEVGIPNIENNRFTLSGRIPVATSLEYSTKLSSLTAGKGKFATSFDGYQECSVEFGEIIPYRGISPLDRAKYILKARKALS